MAADDPNPSAGWWPRLVSALLAPRWRWLWRVLLTALVLIIAVLAFSPPQAVDVPGSDKLHHVLAFVVLMVVGGLALPPGAFGLAGMAAALIGYGVFIEAVQSHLPGRHASVADVLADALGVALGLVLVVLLQRWGSAATSRAPRSHGRNRPE